MSWVLSGHRQIDHTADLALELWGDSEASVLIEGAKAITTILGGDQPQTRGTPAQRTIHIEAIDPEDRLVQWLNEVIFLAVTEGFIFESGNITLSSDTTLDASLEGRHDSGYVMAELKSATYHDLELRNEATGTRARVVLDV